MKEIYQEATISLIYSRDDLFNKKRYRILITQVYI